MSTTAYEKVCHSEVICIGDIISIDPIQNKVRLSYNDNKPYDEFVIGVCTKIDNDTIYVQNTGVVEVNTYGLICIGDKLTTSNIKGTGVAVKYVNQDTLTFGVKSIGKVIELYNDYNKAKIILNID